LGARAGGEVRSFISLGAFAVGVDIAPLHKSPYVLYGNALKIQFGENSVDYVFTNIIDHISDIDAFAREVFRVLKPQGKFLSEVQIQDRKNDPWAVRSTGSTDFFKMYDNLLSSYGLTKCTTKAKYKGGWVNSLWVKGKCEPY